MYNANVAELKVVENFILHDAENFEAFESEDTLSILNRYVEEAQVDLINQGFKRCFKRPIKKHVS